MADIAHLEVGQTLYAVGQEMMAGRNPGTTVVYPVVVESFDRKTAMLRWNGAPATMYQEYQVARLLVNKPVLREMTAGRYRRATPQDVKTAKAAGNLMECPTHFTIARPV